MTTDISTGAYENYSLNDINECNSIESIANVRAKLLSSLLFFTRIFYEIRTGHKFRIGTPMGHESHYITMCRWLTKIFDGRITKLPINMPPRYGKTECLINFIAWSFAHYGDCNFLYTSYGKDLASRQTATIRDIISMPLFNKIFQVQIDSNFSAKDDFKTIQGGSVVAAGAQGAVLGYGAGIRGCNRFGGCIIIDDLHKATEITSDTMRKDDLEWYDSTAKTRRNDGEKTPIIIIGQRLHEGDIFEKLLSDDEGEYKKNHLCLSAITPAGNALCPELHSLDDLKRQEKDNAYHFWAQMMQNPQPAGGSLFKMVDFREIDIPKDILFTFITVDTAETAKTYNDATVFSFWGVHYIEQWGKKTDTLGLVWLDCNQTWVEPRDLEAEFISFYNKSCNFYKKPSAIAIEKKSTGATLYSLIRDLAGVIVLPIERNKASGSKTQRFIDIQTYIAQKRVSLPKDAIHNTMCIEHMGKITANGSHLRDDIADTCYDAVKIALIDKIRYSNSDRNVNNELILRNYMVDLYEEQQNRRIAYGH